MRSGLNRLPDDDRHHCKYREDRDEARAEVGYLWRARRQRDRAYEQLRRERDDYRETLERIARGSSMAALLAQAALDGDDR